MHTCMHAYIHACIHPYIIHACMHTCMHAYIHACMHTCMHTYMNACIHTCMHACIHACIHACMHAYIHTDICIYNVPFSVYVAIASLYCCLVPPCLSKDLSLGEAIRCREGVGLPGHMSRWLAALDLDGAAGRHHVEGYDLLGMVILIWWMWVKQFHRPSPSHHHFYRWFKPFPAMGGKHGVVLPTLIWVWFAGYIIWVWLDLALRQVWQLLMEHFWGTEHDICWWQNIKKTCWIRIPLDPWCACEFFSALNHVASKYPWGINAGNGKSPMEGFI